jgi:membrane-associated phospholipid phosphatase
MKRGTARWWLVAGAGTGALIAYDHRISQQLPNTGGAVQAGVAISRAGQYYSVYPFAGALYYFGIRLRNPEISETGALAVQGLVDSAIVGNLIKVATGRERPLEGDGGGHFGHGGISFPSGHSIEAWTLATVIARRYSHHKWVPAVSYGYATLISVSRVAARQHFPSDVLAGAAMGFFIGKYIVDENRLHRGHVHRQLTWLQPAVSPYLAGGGLGVQLKWSMADRE